ncbi:MAG TPA: Ig-like domain-containing protein [Gemmatimonadaceae bacterium]|nr:Ig-like domain-containing protein [Gemmatimonadaceae bacterium]
MREVSRTPIARVLFLGALASISASCADSGSTPPNGPPTETPVAVSVTPKQGSLIAGETKQLVAQVTVDGRVVTDRTIAWRTSNNTVATVNAAGLVTAVGAGSAKIFANVGAVADSAMLTVASTADAFTIVPGGVQAILGDTLNFTVVASSAAGEAALAAKSVVWSSSDPSIATVSSEGVVATVGEGDVTVKAQVGDQIATASMKVTGSQLASVTVSPSNSSLYNGEVLQLSASMLDDNRRTMQNRPATWNSSDPSVVGVSATGLVTAIKKGVAVITVRAENKRASATVNVLGAPVSGVLVTLAKPSLGVGQTTTATAVIKDAQGIALTDKIVAWQSSNPALATVNSAGAVTAIAAGSVTISAISEGKVGGAGLTITSSRAATVAIVPAAPAAMVGQSSQLSLDVRDASGTSLSSRPATWTSASPAVATVSASGLVSAIAVGTSTITATVDGIAATATFTVTTVPITSVSVSPTQLSLSPGGTAQLSVAAANNTAATGTSRPITWASSNAAVATVDASGIVAAVAPGNANIFATVEGITAAAAVTVAAPPPAAVASISIAFTPNQLAPGQTAQAVATPRDAAGNALTGRTIQWSSVDPTLATVSSSGVITAIAAGSVTIVATSEGITGASTLSVTSAAPAPIAAVSVTVSPSTVVAGGTSQATVRLTDAAGNVLTGRTIAWSSSMPSLATINASGTLTAIAAGTSTISATSEGKTGANTLTVTAPVLPPTVASVTVTVNPTSVNVGQTSQASAVAKASNGSVITGRAISFVMSTGGANASVSSSGVVTGVAAGSATVSAIVDGITGSATLTVNAPATPPPTGDLASRIMGATISTAEAKALGGAFSAYETNFVTYDEQQWATNGASWASMDYYDRAMIYYAWHRRTGDAKYLSRANAIALDYRKNYLEAANYVVQAHWSMLDGVAMHYLTTNDEASRLAIGKVADMFTGLTYRDQIGTRTGTDNRVQARYIVALLLANQLQSPSVGIASGGIPGGHDWAAELRRALPMILSTQDADGAWRLSDCGDGGPRTVHPFTTGLLMDALSRYYDLFEADPRIPGAIKRAADYLWANDWVPTERAFKYIERVCPTEGGPTPTADLNNLIVNGFAWTYKMTGDVTYRQRADDIFAGAVAGAWISPSKQFNQVYSSSYRYLAWRK